MQQYIKLFLIIILFILTCKIYSQENEKNKIVYTKNNNLEIKNLKTGEIKKLTTGNLDVSPSWSPSSDIIVFVRIKQYSSLVEYWKTSICIINTDGTGFKILTNGYNADFNPTWTRDGSNKIIFTRYFKKYEKASIYTTSVYSNPDDEILISDKLNSEIAYSSLKDGRILIGSTREFIKGKYYLFTPNPGSTGKYELININFELKGYLKNLSFSPDETKIVCEYNESWNFFNFDNTGIYIADIDIKNLNILKVYILRDNYLDASNPQWSNNGETLIYNVYNKYINFNNSDIFFYSLKNKNEKKFNNDDYKYEYPCFESTPK